MEKDINDILALFACSFNKEETEEWFRWKYQNSPFGSKGYVVMDTEKVVAFYGGIKLPFSFMGKTLWAYQFCDVMTHPQYRGRFIGKRPLIVKLGEMFYRENPMDFAFGFPSLRHARLQSLRLGGEGYRIVRAYKKEQLKNYSMLWKLKVNEGWEFLKEEELNRFCNINGVPKTFGTTPCPTDGRRALSRGDFPSPLAGEPARQIRSDGGKGEGDAILKLVKNEGYIRWRYVENPLKKYGLFIFKRMKRTKGYIVFTVEDDLFNILEIFYERDNDVQDILVALETYIVKNMKTLTGIRLWFHPMDPVTGHLDELGYTSEDSIPLAFRSVNTVCGVTSEIFYGRYFYRMGDYDAS